jgi:hypothetical protein
MKLAQEVPELVADVKGGLIRLGRGALANQLDAATVVACKFDDFAQATYIQLAPTRDLDSIAEVVSLYDDVPVNVELDREGRIVGLDVEGYEEVLSRLGGNQ